MIGNSTWQNDSAELALVCLANIKRGHQSVGDKLFLLLEIVKNFFSLNFHLEMSETAAPDQQQPKSPSIRSMSTGGSSGFQWRGLVEGAEKTANEMNSQFAGFCNKLTGDKKEKNEKTEEEGKHGIMRQLSDIGSKSFGLMKDIEKKFDHGKTTTKEAAGEAK